MSRSNVVPLNHASPWKMEGFVELSGENSKHLVVPCVWSGPRISHIANEILAVVAVGYAALVVGAVFATSLARWLGWSYWGLLIAAVLFDVLGSKRIKGKWGGQWRLTLLTGLFGAGVFIVKYTYVYLEWLPAAAMLVLWLLFAGPALRSAFSARNLAWSLLIIGCTLGLGTLFVALGRILGAVALNVDLLFAETATGFFWISAVLVSPLLVCGFIAGVLYKARALEILDLIHDVTRYVGRKKKRRGLDVAFGELVNSIRSLAPRSQLVVVSHSLGTVVSTSALLQMPGQRVHLVTMGSPIHFMTLVYPRVVRDPQFLADQLSSKGSVASWLNLWRDSDPIGRSLAVKNVSFRQRSLGPGGHADYWNDKRTWDEIARRISNQTIEAGVVEPAESMMVRRGLPLLATGTVLIWLIAGGAWMFSGVNASAGLSLPKELSVLTTEPSRLTGRLVNQGGDPAFPGIGIRLRTGLLGSIEAVTDELGGFDFDQIRRGDYSIEIEREAFEAGDALYHYRQGFERTISVVEGAQVRHDEILYPVGHIRGRVLDSSGRPAIAIVLNPGRPGDQTRVDRVDRVDGSFDLRTLWPPLENLPITIRGFSPQITRRFVIPRSQLEFSKVFELGEVVLHETGDSEGD